MKPRHTKPSGPRRTAILLGSLFLASPVWAEQPTPPQPRVPPAPRQGTPKEIADREAQIKALMEQSNVPIDFYGQVIDETGKPVAGARIPCSIKRSQNFVKLPEPLVSGADGRFSIRNERGSMISFGQVEKADYRVDSRESRTFAYFGTPPQYLHHPDAAVPMQFLVISKTASRPKEVFSGPLRYRWNQGPVRLPIGVPGITLVLKPERTREPGARRDFPWKLDLSVEGGELAPFPPYGPEIAPASGYAPSIHFGSDSKEIETPRQWVLKTTAGLYARLTFDLYPDREDGEKGASLRVELNEGGTRNLEH